MRPYSTYTVLDAIGNHAMDVLQAGRFVIYSGSLLIALRTAFSNQVASWPRKLVAIRLYDDRPDADFSPTSGHSPYAALGIEISVVIVAVTAEDYPQASRDLYAAYDTVRDNLLHADKDAAGWLYGGSGKERDGVLLNHARQVSMKPDVQSIENVLVTGYRFLVVPLTKDRD